MEKLWGKFRVFLARFAYLKRRSRIRRYTVPVLLTLVAYLVELYLYESYVLITLDEAAAFFTLTIIVTISSWYGGLGPGILATILSTIGNYFLLIALGHYSQLGNIVLSIFFILEGVVISIISEARYESEEQKDEFIAFAAHELKNPLSSVRGFAELILNKTKSNQDQKVFAYAQEIQTQSDKLLELINDLLDVTKIEVGKFSYKDELIDMNSLVKEIISHQKVINKNREIILTGKSSQIVRGDRYRIGQVITNLMTNALKYSPENRKVLVNIKNKNHSVIISVKDFGVGISQKDQTQIFSPFYRTTKAQTSKSEGLGLGLYIASQIVLYHQGRLWVKSTQGHGSTFFMELPIS